MSRLIGNPRNRNPNSNLLWWGNSLMNEWFCFFIFTATQPTETAEAAAHRGPWFIDSLTWTVIMEHCHWDNDISSMKYQPMSHTHRLRTQMNKGFTDLQLRQNTMANWIANQLSISRLCIMTTPRHTVSHTQRIPRHTSLPVGEF